MSNDVIFELFFSQQIQTPFNFLLMNMILAETIIACFGIPVDSVASFQHGWKMGKRFCFATGFILSTAGWSVSIWVIRITVIMNSRL